MITAVDTNILLDVFLPAPRHAKRSIALLKRAYDEGALVICEIVYAELTPQFKMRQGLDNALKQINVTLSPIDSDVAFLDLHRSSAG